MTEGSVAPRNESHRIHSHRYTQRYMSRSYFCFPISDNMPKSRMQQKCLYILAKKRRTREEGKSQDGASPHKSSIEQYLLPSITTSSHGFATPPLSSRTKLLLWPQFCPSKGIPSSQIDFLDIFFIYVDEEQDKLSLKRQTKKEKEKIAKTKVSKKFCPQKF